MRSIYFFIYFILLSSFCQASYQLELEHTFAEAEGSSWGIEGVLKNRLDIPESDLPILYKTPLRKASPLILSLKDQPATKDYFIQDSLFLYQKMNICIDQNIRHDNEDFASTLNLFLKKVSQVNQKETALKVTLTPIDFDHVHSSSLENCDVLSFIGKKNQFPFLQVQDAPAPHFSTTPQMLLGMYFRFSNSTIPVIVFNPSIQLDFHPKQAAYVQTNAKNEIIVDARILFFHELGHLIGFTHLKEGGSWKPFSSLTVMGVNSTQIENYAVDFRYNSSFNIWENWDLRQTSLYRALLARWQQGDTSPVQSLFFDAPFNSNTFCFLPEEQVHIAFTPLSINGLNGNDKPDSSGAIQKTIDLTGHGASVSSKLETLITDYNISSYEFLKMIEFHNTSQTPYLDHLSLERSISDYPTIENGSIPQTDEWLMLSLSGQLSPLAQGQFNLSGFYTINQNVRISFTMIRLNIQDNQANCYKK